MRSLLAFVCVFLPSLIAYLTEPSVTFFTSISNLALVIISCILLNNYNLIKTHLNVVLFFITLISIISLFSYNDSIKLGSELFPYVPGGDGEKYFVQARYLSKGNPLDAPNIITLNYLGYQIILGLWFKMIGTNLFYGLFLNYAVLTISLILLSISTYLLTENKSISYYTLILSLACSHFIASGIILLKDVFFLFSFSLILLTVMKYYRGSKSPLLLLNLIIAGLIIGSLRLPFLVIIPIVAILIGRFYSSKNLILVGIMIAGFIAALPLFLSLTMFKFSEEKITGIVMETSFVEEELKKEKYQGGAVQRLIGGYTSMPTSKRLALLPIPILIQFVTPFKFWSTDFKNDHIYHILDQLNIFWYGFVGVLMFIVLLKLKWIENSNVRKLFIFGFLMYSVMAFIYGGTIPRYSMPFILFMMPAMGYILYLSSKYIPIKNYMIKFFSVYFGIGVCLFCLYLAIKMF